VADGIAESCGAPWGDDYFGQRRYPIRYSAFACSDSSQCAEGTVCCAAHRPSTTRDDLAGPAFPKILLCTDHPADECADIEECRRETCRTTWPEITIPCGTQTCRGRSVECRYDGRARTDHPGPQLPPYCAHRGDPERMWGEDHAPCRSPADCPAGAQCIFRSFSTLNTVCDYQHVPLALGHSAPACMTDADCAAVLPRWQPFLGWTKAEEIHCRPAADDPAGRSICTTAKGTLF
jgi:hypothetical protein